MRNIFKSKTPKQGKIIVLPDEKPTGLVQLIKPRPIAADDGPRVRAKGEKVTPRELRQLRDLLRQRYGLDLAIWDLRAVGVHDRPVVEDDMRRADALLRRIRALVVSMDGREYWESDAEYRRFLEVKARVTAGGKRNWAAEPPWKE